MTNATDQAKQALAAGSAKVPLCNVTERLGEMAAQRGDQLAIVAQGQRRRDGMFDYTTITLRELDQRALRIARGLKQLGAVPGMRLALLVKPGIEFISLVFGLLRSGAVAILIDPGMGRRNTIRCLQEVEPEGFIAIAPAQALRTLLRRKFPRARLNVTLGRRWFWGGATYDQLLGPAQVEREPIQTRATDPAAIIFTTGSTGPPKGVLYTHGIFDCQVTEIRDTYQIQPGEVDLAGFPLFGLFNAAMGVTTIVPNMDASRPAQARPEYLVAAAQDQRATQAFASPAVWRNIGPYCAAHGVRLDRLRRVLSAGAPVPPSVLREMKHCLAPDAEMHTPYGATEALPVATISASEVLGETAELWASGRGTCVGRRFPGITWQVIRTVDGPLPSIDQVEPLPVGEIGELIVTGEVVTRQYVTRTEANALAKIHDGQRIWHRMGDVGYLDAQDRFWFCGRMAHRVRTAEQTLYTIVCEAIFNQHPAVARSALVGIGSPGRQRPVIIAEVREKLLLRAGEPRQRLLDELRQLAHSHEATRMIDSFLLHDDFPVDIRHNAKIFREKLAVWAADQLA